MTPDPKRRDLILAMAGLLAAGPVLAEFAPARGGRAELAARFDVVLGSGGTPSL